MIKAILVDDNISSTQLLKWVLEQHCKDVEVVATASKADEAIAKIEMLRPDILFLDIQMPNQSGFDLLSSLKNWNFEVIFVTAFDSYAIDAIKFSALDYLLKPVDEAELIKAIDRFKVKKIYAPGGEELYKNFIQNLSVKNKQQQRLALPSINDIKYVFTNEIIRLQSERNYTRLFFNDKKDFLSSKTLKDFDDILKQSHFLRVHKSHLVNPDYIVEYDRDGFLKLSNNDRVEVSRRKKEYVLDFIQRRK